MTLAESETAQALVEVGRQLMRRGYHFVTVTPATHARVVGRAKHVATDLRDIFGWNLPFDPAALPAEIRNPLVRAGCCRPAGDLERSAIRFSTLGGRSFVHSAFPTDEHDAVFLGPDTYRFAAAVLRHAPLATRVVDIGCGAGVGGILLADRARELVLADINERALLFTAVNATLAGLTPTIVHSDLLAAIDGDIDLVIANPPYMLDVAGRTYRDGGGTHGQALGVRIVEAALGRLRPGGVLLLYTGAAIVGGRDTFRDAVAPAIAGHVATYDELDPDVFGEQLDEPGYEDVERIAAVLLRVEAR